MLKPRRITTAATPPRSQVSESVNKEEESEEARVLKIRGEEEMVRRDRYGVLRISATAAAALSLWIWNFSSDLQESGGAGCGWKSIGKR